MRKMKTILPLLVTACASTGAYADTILSVTETHYDADLRPDCVALRMNPATFAEAPSDACIPKASVGAYGPDRVTKKVYDGAGQILAIYRGVGTSSIIQYAYYNYNLIGQKAFEIDANHNKTTYLYDTLNRLSAIQYPNATVGNEVSSTTDTEQFGYDDNGNRTWWKRRNGVYIYYNYDNLNRQILTYPDNASIPNLYTRYDLQGHILYKRFNGTSDIQANPGVTYTYDPLGRGVATKDMNGRTVAYNYDEASRRLRMYYPDSANYVYYTRDYLGRVTGTNFGGVSEYLYQQTFDSRGFPYTLTRGNSAFGGTTSYTVDAIGRMSGMSINIDGTTTAHDASWTFTRNPAGQVYSWTSTGPYDYVEAATSTVAKTYDGLNRDAAIAAVSGGYDANGNVTKDATRVMKYDVYNRLLSVAAIATPTTPYLTLTYDTEGRLSAVTTTAGTKEFLYDGTNLIGEYTHVGSSSTVHTSDTMAARYVHGEGVDQPLVWYTSSAITAPRYLFANYQGSVIAYTNSAGAFQESYHYDPYGNPVNPTGGTYWFGSRFRFTGQVALPEAYLYYYKARIYDPAAGRFLQTDPVGGKDDLDLYAYVGGDPVNNTDPTGQTVQIHGSNLDKKAFDELVGRATGLTLTHDQNFLKVKGGRDVTKGNKRTAQRLVDAINSKTLMTMDLVSDDPSTIFDDYSSNKVDVGDLKKAEKTSPRFLQAILSHFIAERQYNLDNGGHVRYPDAHDQAKIEEAKDMGAAYRWDPLRTGEMTINFDNANGQTIESFTIQLSPDGNPQ